LEVFDLIAASPLCTKQTVPLYGKIKSKGAAMRIARTILLLAGVTMLIPTPPDDDFAARQSWQILAEAESFCSRQPAVCASAGYIAAKLEAKAKYGVRLLYDWANEANGTPNALQAESELISASSRRMASVAGNQSQSTLTIDDLLPRWRGPRPNKG
jgi:hypothetical protein